MNEGIRGLFSGSAGGMISSICCITPLVLLLLGIGNLSLAATMGAYRIYFILAGLVFVSLSMAYHIRRKMRYCGCSGIQILKQESRLIFTAFASFFIIFGLINFIVLPFVTAKITGKPEGFAEKDSQLRQLELRIDGMTCDGCAVAIESALRNVNGVLQADVSYANGSAVIIYDPSLISLKEIVDSVPEPYLAEIISDREMGQ